MVLCVDPVTNKFVFLNGEGKKASKPPTGALVRLTTDPAKLTNLVYQDKSTTVEVVPLDMNRIIPMPFPLYQRSSAPSVPAYQSTKRTSVPEYQRSSVPLARDVLTVSELQQGH